MSDTVDELSDGLRKDNNGLRNNVRNKAQSSVSIDCRVLKVDCRFCEIDKEIRLGTTQHRTGLTTSRPVATDNDLKFVVPAIATRADLLVVIGKRIGSV